MVLIWKEQYFRRIILTTVFRMNLNFKAGTMFISVIMRNHCFQKVVCFSVLKVRITMCYSSLNLRSEDRKKTSSYCSGSI